MIQIYFEIIFEVERSEFDLVENTRSETNTQMIRRLQSETSLFMKNSKSTQSKLEAWLIILRFLKIFFNLYMFH